jgi:uncharacterized protein YggT (Ycf19 family)
MSLLDSILNLVGLLFWIHARAASFRGAGAPSRLSLISALKRTEPSRARWFSLGALAALIFFRALFYWQLGAPIDWRPRISLAAIVLTFRSDLFTRMLLYSMLSFVFTLLIFYFWLLLLSMMNSRMSNSDPIQKLVRQHLGWLEDWPIFLKIFLPPLMAAGCWTLLHPLLVMARIVPTVSLAHLLEQSAIIGVAAWLTWKYLIATVLVLHVLGSYVYFGHLHLWTYLSVTAKAILRPLRWIPLRLPRVDFAPLVMIALVFFLAELSERGLAAIYQRLPP